MISALTLATLVGSAVLAEPNTAVVRGRVADVSGKPAQGAEVAFYTSADTKRPADFVSNRTRDDGRYVAVLPAGTYWAVARMRKAERYGPLDPDAKHSGAPEKVRLDAGTQTQLDFVIASLREAALVSVKKRPDFHVLRGRILDGSGKPRAGWYAFASRPGHSQPLPQFISAWTGADGRFVLHVPAGRLELGATAIFPPPLPLVPIRSVEVAADMADLDLVVETVE